MNATRTTYIPARSRQFWGVAGLLIVAIALLAALTTFAILTGLTPVLPTRDTIIWLLAFNGLLVLTMAIMVATQFVTLVLAKHRGRAGAGLHIRLVSLFSLVAVLPAMVVAVFAAVTLSRGLDAWFSDRTRAIVDSSVTVAEAYMREHSELTRGDVAAIAATLNQERALYDRDRAAFARDIKSRNFLMRGLVGVFVFDVFDPAARQFEAEYTVSGKVAFIPPPEDMIKRANSGELVIIPPRGASNLIRGLVKLSAYDSLYLYVYRTVNPSVIRQLATTRVLKAEYDDLLAQRAGVQITFALMYAGVAFVFLLGAIWLGLWFADRLVDPIARVLVAARLVSEGDLDAKVAIGDGPGDLKNLGRTFNRMTDDLKRQRSALIHTNSQLDERHRFTEAVLRGVSAGIIGLTPDGHISLMNRSALDLLGRDEAVLVGSSIYEALPEFAAILKQAMARPSGLADAQIEMKTAGRQRSFIVQVTTEMSDEAEHGYVVTFDDITELVSAQRNSAWADIARRIAHEIKNPLTPIQLSAERLKRKYSREITTDKHVFEQCTDTIIRQVGDIGRMVDEFSSFARMPSAVLETNNLNAVVQEATLLQRVTARGFVIDVVLPDEPVRFSFDRRLITQAVTNLVKNAAEAIEARQQNQPEPEGRIVVEAGLDAGTPFIRVTDNGVGLPRENRHRLTEPYMTTREKGTGLGLAIVKRIMEEHQGELRLSDAPESFAGGLGACVELRFKTRPPDTETNALEVTG